MPSQMKSFSTVLTGVFLFLMGFVSVVQAEPVPVNQILTPGLIPLQLPAFHDDEMAGVDFEKMFNNLPAQPGPAWPKEGQSLMAGTEKLTWRLENAGDGGFQLEKPGSGAEVQHLVFYVESDRWQKASLEVNCAHPVIVSLGKEKIALGEKDDAGLRTAELTLPIGKHQMALRILLDSSSEEEGGIQLALNSKDESENLVLAPSVDPNRSVTIQTILEAPRVGSVSICPDGRFTVLNLSEYRDGKNKESWLEIRRTEDLKLERYLRGMGSPSSVSWHPGTGKQTALTWETSSGDHSTVWLFNLESGEARAVLEHVAELGRWQWAPDGKSIIYEIGRSPDADARRVKHVLHPADRQSWWRNRNHLMQAFVDGGFERQLTAGPLNPDGWQISPDSGSLVFFTNEGDWTNRPFQITKLWHMDLETLALKELLNDPWLGGAIFSPDGKTLCLTGSPSAFDGLGRNLPDGVQANDYGGQVFLMDLDDLKPRAISVDFVPDVGWTHWSAADGMIYTRCTDTQHSNIHRYNPKKDRWEKVETGVEYTNQISVPETGKWAVARGTSANHPNTVQVIDLKKNQVKKVFDPGVSEYQDAGIVFGKVETWVADLPNGEKLDGFVYYPPDFDASKKYPLIVYYYGGTSPVTKDFGGRYPKNVWAGQGYVVYVPNPSGATGYGQAMAARHVNDWGRITAGEVIDGTQAFLKAHDFAMADKIGCIGASYGGFLTEYIVSQTDIFAAGVSHAGISSISSYWGEGMWGYAYGTRALANSYPWMDRDLYVEQSALFHADKINTPLLLVHGDSDINVPIGESDQLFTALKILGREVEYVQIVGQDHHILDHEQRIVWNDTILAFFARHLKDRSAWWDALYPEPTDYR
jgi:dipeptidyl aminopeptidase/acylaminoacyl peptidase